VFGSSRLPSSVRKASTSSQGHGESTLRTKSFSRSASKSSEMMSHELNGSPQQMKHSSTRNASKDGPAMFANSDPFQLSVSDPAYESSESILSRGRPIPSVHSSYGTPETHVPTGPDSSSARKSQYNPLLANPAKGSNLRTTSMQSLASDHDNPRLSTIDTRGTDQRAEFKRQSSARNLREQSSSLTATPAGNMQKYGAVTPTEEKRGFFKRVFGNSSSRPNLAMGDSQDPSLSRQGSVSNLNGQQASPAPSQAGSNAPSQQLNKKSSSFFRRKKKSIDNSSMPPALPPLAQNEVPASPSAGSLYKVMDPYLTGSPSSPAKMVARDTAYEPRFRKMEADSPSATTEDSNDPDIFHSGYADSPEVSLNVASAGAESDPRRPSAAPSSYSVSSNVHPIMSKAQQPGSPDAKMKVKRKDKPAPLDPQAFFQDLNESDSRFDRSGRLESNASMMALKSPTGPLISPMGALNLTSSPLMASISPRMGSSRSPTSSPIIASHAEGVTEIRPQLIVDTAPSVKRESGPSSGKAANERVWLEPSPVDDRSSLMSPGDVSPLESHVSANITSPIELGLGLYPGQTMPDAEGISPSVDEGLSPFDRRGSDAPRNMSVFTTATSMTAEQDERDRALQIYEGKDILVMRGQACAWLGENKIANAAVLSVFMEIFNFTGKTILGGMRMLCEKLALKGESQQVDRVLDAFATRWCECNPEHGFQIKDVVHTICYSILLLNTDLHMADIESKMTRAQFTKNTLPTIKRIVADAPPEAFERPVKRPAAGQKPGLPWQDSTGSIPDAPGSPAMQQPEAQQDKRRSVDSRRPTLTKRMSWSFGLTKDEHDDWSPPHSGSTALIDERFDGKPTEWHFELESILKSFFTAIKSEPLPMYKEKKQSFAGQDGRPRRAGSIKSVAPSEMSMRSKKTGFHSMSSRWTKKAGIHNKFYASSTMASSRTSFDDNSSVFSPAGGSTWSRYSQNKSMTTVSSDGMNTYADQGFQQSIGFANALSQSNARDDPEVEDDNVSFNPQKFLIEDETLELAGAPWAKEGILKHKHHLEASDKKAKERNWSECFAVIEKGYLRLFSFNSKGGKSGSLGIRKQVPRGKAASLAPSVVGGGNWMQNAEQLGSFLLRQTIASTLPPPGYSKARPHVWALSLPSGAVHLFQVGTAEIASEFMNTANYWSARLSKEPLTGGVDNIEYGWSENIVNAALLGNNGSGSPEIPSLPPSRHGATHSAHNSMSMPPPHSHRQSIASSMRGSVDLPSGMIRSRLPGDKAHLDDWKPPVQSMMASQLMEVDQLKALKDYITSIEGDLSRHNELRQALSLAVSSFPFPLIISKLLLIRCAVHPPPPEPRQSHLQLGEEILVPAARNHQVPDIYRRAGLCADAETGHLRRARGAGEGEGGARGAQEGALGGRGQSAR